MSEEIKDVLDWTAVSTAIATFFGMLPNIAALLSVVWLLLRIWESRTVINFIKNVRGK